MKHTQRTLLILLALFLAGSASAQTVRSLLRKANNEYELHAFNLAIDSYQQVLERRPDEVEALGNIADCYRHLNELEQAADYYARAVQSRRVERRHILNFAKTLKGLGRYDEARGYFIQYGQEGGDASVGNHYAETCEWAKRQGGSNPDINVENERVSTPASDFGPAYYRDRVVFSSARTDIQRSTYNWDGQAKNQLFISQTTAGGQLQPPVFLKGEATERGEGPVSFSSDGTNVAFTRNNFVSGTRHLSTSGMEISLFLAEVGPDGQWYNERAFPHNDPNGHTGYPAFTPDGEAMFFASDRQGGYGGYDIYISYRQNESWTFPINLGPAVNTPGDEIAPFFDGTNLYFASDWHIGFGGYDIFQAEQGNGQWTSVSNVGLPINSPRDDYGYVYDNLQNVGYLASNRVGGRGAEDLYRVSRAGSSVLFRVVSASDGRPVAGAQVNLSNCTGNSYGNDVFTTDGRGVVTFPVDASMNCELIVNGQGYAQKRYNLNGYQATSLGEVEISLVRTGEQFFGRVIDANSRNPVSNIVVIARNQNTGSTSRSTTSATGEFSLALQPNTQYIITYSGAGFREISRNLTTNETISPSVLGTIPLYSSGSVIDPGIDPGNTGNNSGNNSGGVTNRGYAIQLGVFSRPPNMSAFSNIQTMGDVYVVQEGGRYKARLGVFTTRSEAQNLVSSVQSRGYNGAFIVEESGGSATSGGVSGNPNPPANPGSAAGNPNAVSGSYKIQLAALRNTRWFDPSKVNQYGVVEDFRRGDLTIKLLSGFRSLDEARRILPSVQRNGFSGAFIVQEVNGQLQKVR
jgi:hypothetical protein